MPVNKKNIERWVIALRSGKYKQTRDVLHKVRGGYCCLGVACEVAIKNKIEVEKIKAGKEYKYDQCSVSLPNSVSDWLGIESEDPLLFSDRKKHSASYWNDSEKYSFKEIAKLIEYTFLKKKGTKRK